MQESTRKNENLVFLHPHTSRSRKSLVEVRQRRHHHPPQHQPLLPITRTHPPHSPRVIRKPILDILKRVGSKTKMKHEVLG